MTIEQFEKLVSTVFKKFMDTFFRLNINPKIVKDDETKNYDNVIFISLFGDIEGGFILEVDNGTVEKFLDKIEQKIHQSMDLSQFVKGYIGEFANILVSRIVGNLGKNFGDTFLSTPSLFSGVGMTANLFYDDNLKTTIESDFGCLRISFSVRN